MPESYTLDDLAVPDTQDKYTLNELSPSEDKRTLGSQLAVKIPEVISDWGLQFPKEIDGISKEDVESINRVKKEAALREATKRISESPIMPILRGIGKTAQGAAEFARTPEGLGLTALGAVAPESIPASRALATYMGLTAAEVIGTGAGTLSVPGSSAEDATKEILNMGLMTLGSGAAARLLPNANKAALKALLAEEANIRATPAKAPETAPISELTEGLSPSVQQRLDVAQVPKAVVPPGISMGFEQARVPQLGTPPTFEPSGQKISGPVVEPDPLTAEFTQRMGRPPSPEESQSLRSGQIEFQDRPDRTVERANALKEQDAQRQRTLDFAKATSEKVSQQHEPPVTPDKPLTDNQLRIIHDSLKESVEQGQIPGARKGLIVGSELDKWADDVLKGGGTHSGPDVIAAYLVKGASLVERGVTEFAKWSAEMVREFGDQVKPHLKALHEQAQKLRAQDFAKTVTSQRPAQASQVSQSAPTLTMDHGQSAPATATPPSAPPPAASSLLSRIRSSLPRAGDIRERFRPIERKDSPAVARNFVETVNAGTQARTIIHDFMRRAFKGGDAEKLASDFVSLGQDNRRRELQSRHIPATQVPALTGPEAARIRSDPHIQRAIKIWNSEIAPMIEEIRTRNGMIMSPSWNSMDLMLNLPGEYNPVNQTKSGVNLSDVYNQPAIGEGSYQTDPVESLNQIVRGHLRYDSASKLANSIRSDVSIPPQTVVDPQDRLSPSSFPKPRRGEWFEAPYKGRTEKVEPINLNPDQSGTPDYHYVPKRVAESFNKLRQERGNYDTWGDKVLGSITQFGVLPGTFLPHVVRELSAVSARIAQSGQSVASMLPSWLGSNELAIRRLSQMKDTPYGQIMQRFLDKSGADRGVGYGIKDAKTKLGKILKFPHEMLFHPDYGVDVLARRAIADAHLRMQLGNQSVDAIENGLKSGTMTIPQAMTQLQAALGDADVLALGRRVNNTMGYGNPQTRTQTLNWAQRLFPFISSESGKIPDEIRRLVTLNMDAPALKKSLGRNQYGQAGKQIGGMMANGAIGVYLLQNAINYLTTKQATGKGQPMDKNPEGRRTDVYLAPNWYWSNLDPGLARAARITGAKETANTGKAPDVPREVVNEAMSVLHPGIRLAFSALTHKSMYMDATHGLTPSRKSDLIPFSPARNTIEAAARNKPIGAGAIKDAAALTGVQLVGKPTDPKIIRAAKLNDFANTLAREARSLPMAKRREFIDSRIKKLPESDRHEAYTKVRRHGVLKHEQND